MLRVPLSEAGAFFFLRSKVLVLRGDILLYKTYHYMYD